MKKKVFIAGLALFVAMGVYLGYNKDTSSYKIGLLGPFTGNAAVFGDFMQRGFDLATEDMRPDQLANLEIVKEDDMCKGQNAVSAVQKLINVDRVKYVIGPLCNEASVATEKLFEENGVLSITIGLPSNQIANMGPYHFSFSPEIEYLIKALVHEVQGRNIKRVAVIHMNGTFEKENYVHFMTYTQKEGVEVVSDEEVVKGTADFKSVILKVKQSNPDAVMLIAHTGELNNILQQLSDIGLGYLPKFGIHAAESPVLLQKIQLAEGLIYAYPGDKKESDSARAYAIRYKEKYGSDPDPSSANVYDSLLILTNAIKLCGYENTECVQQTLANLKGYQGANGILSVDERGVGMYKEIMLKTVKDGQFQKLK